MLIVAIHYTFSLDFTPIIMQVFMLVNWFYQILTLCSTFISCNIVGFGRDSGGRHVCAQASTGKKIRGHNTPLKFIYSEKAKKLCEISTVDLSYVVPVKSTVEISQNFVSFSEYMNFNSAASMSSRAFSPIINEPANNFC